MLVAAMALCAMMVFSSFTVMAQSVAGSLSVPQEWNDSAQARLLMERFERDRGRPRERDERTRALSAFSTVRVNVHVVVDQHWVTRHGNTYRWEALDSIFDGGDFYWQHYGIDIRGNSAISRWTSPDSDNASLLLLNAMNNHGLGGSGNRLMAAFTGRDTLIHGGGVVDGLAQEGRWGFIIRERGWRINNATVRHEIGHNYGLPDHPRSGTIRCFMRHPTDNFDNICNNCNNWMTRNRNRF